jgi:putative phosphoesterase
MLIALLADTHDNARTTRAAVELLRSHQPAAWLHAGDLVHADMFEHFAGLPAGSFHYVFGNNEVDLAELFERAAALHLTCHGRFADLTLAGKRLALTHGHEHSLLDRLIFSRQYDYIIHGHTHTRRDERINGTRIINPGAVHRTKRPTVALLDLAADSLEFLDVTP